MHGQPQHRLVIVPHQLLKGGAIATLRFADQQTVVDAAWTMPSHGVPHREVWGAAVSFHRRAFRARMEILANHQRYCPRIGRHVFPCPRLKSGALPFFPIAYLWTWQRKNREQEL